jgi:uncharacterized tellurite resistance protein B-like protein
LARKSSEGTLILLGIGAFVVMTIFKFIVDNWKVLLPLAIVGCGFWLYFRKNEDVNNENFNQRNSQNINSLRVTVSDYSDTKAIKLANPDTCWKKSGEAVVVKDISISKGLIYVGSSLQSVNNYYSVEPALINPRSKIDNHVTTDYKKNDLPYWSSYSEISEQSRATYLIWLSSDRNDPDINIGYVFLYYYGLERRVLADVDKSASAREELPIIKAEIKRLLDIYGSNPSFNNYAVSLLGYLSDFREKIDNAPSYYEKSWDLPFEYKVALGNFAVKGLPLSAEWAYAWLMLEPSIYLRTPAIRCKDEFKKLFFERYKSKFGEGIKLPINKTRLKQSYRPASSSLRGAHLYDKSTDLPDVSVLSGPINKLIEVADFCTEKLDRYSRILGRNPDKAGTLDAALELPVSLWDEKYQKPLLDIKSTIETAGIPATIKFSKLLSWLPESKEMNRQKYTALSSRLAELGLAIEPDTRFGGGLPSEDTQVVLFKDDISFVSPNTRYSAAALTMQLAVAVSSADGGTNDAEKSYLISQLEGWLHLDDAEKRRLKAHLRWLILEGSSLAGMKKRIETLPIASRENLGDFLTEVAHADNEVSAAEVKVLEQIYKALGLNSSSLYSKLHAPASEPVTVQSSNSNSSNFKIPKPKKADKSKVNLDMAKVASLHAESEKISAILGEIFTDESFAEIDKEDVEIIPDEKSNYSILSLDDTHASFLRLLCTRPTWTLEELNELAEDRSLMLGGALENINEAVYEKFDQPFTEGEDPVEINQEIVMEIIK